MEITSAPSIFKKFHWRIILLFLLIFTVSIVSFKANAQTLTPVRGTVYTVSGIGLGFTAGETHNLLQPKLSTTAGLNIALKNRSFFIYPAVNFLVFRYHQQVQDENYNYQTIKGRASETALSVSLGYREIIKQFSIYQFAGAGAALLKEPRIKVNRSTSNAEVVNEKSYPPVVVAGIGVDYLLGQFMLFAEVSHVHSLKQIQQQHPSAFPVFVGIKSNISGLFKSKK